MSISQVGQADLRLALPGRDQGSADFETAVKTSRLGLSLDGKAQTQGPDAKLDNLLERLLTTLQPQRGDRQQGPGNTPPSGEGPMPRLAERGHGPVVHGGPGPVIPDQPGGEQSDTAQLLQKVITLLNKQLDSGQLDPKQADQIAKLLPKLEQKFVSLADPQAGGSQKETELLSQLDAVLGGSDQQGGPGGPVDSEKSVTPEQRSYDPSAGISGDEISAMIANANGQGPEVDFASYDRTSTGQA